MTKTKIRYNWDHLHVLASDPAATGAWFEDVLGAEIVVSPARIEARFGEIRIFIDAKTGTSNSRPLRSKEASLDHLALLVEDLDAAVDDLRSRHVQFTVEPHSSRPGSRMCFIEGPDGIAVEILERSG
ncbi:VOC family protein [Palleronia marisminoris]|uniref:VOC family protein n=1 Tax=Palleronia marisminoris TaxID=315423 RepID=UPI000A26E787|nr:VOC family protein [Palleronia marisminoris]